MSISKEKKDLNGMLMLLTVVFLAVIIINWMLALKLWLPQEENILYEPLLWFYHKFEEKLIFVRIIYMFGILGYSWLTPSLKIGKKIKDKDVKWYLLALIINLGIVLLGPINYYLYDLIVFPFSLLFLVYTSAVYFSKQKKNVDEEAMLEDVSSKKENEMSFSFKTDKGILVNHSPQQGVWIEGGAGSGKSASLVEPYIHEAVKKGFAGLIYDFKGNPPTLALTAYNAIKQSKKCNVEFKMINFSMLPKSSRCNPIAPKYLPNQLFASEAADIIMKNLQKDWIKKTDFWAENAISILKGAIWMLRKNYPEYCTLPHAISLVLNDYVSVLDFFKTDEEVRRMLLPVITAHEQEASGQIAGAIASVQLPLTKLMNEEVFWVLSKDELDLDVTNKENPIMLSVCNDPSLKESLSPAISLIISVCMQQMNQQGKNKSVFVIDELPTIYIKNLDNLPATGRSNKICTILSVQDYAQLERDYGKDEAKVIISNLGTQHTGMTNNYDTAERVSKTLGKIKKSNTSYSTSESSLSESESLKEETVMQAREVAGQDIGHFTGKIAGGEPPFYSAQFPYFDKEKVYKPYVDEIEDIAIRIKTKDHEVDLRIFKEQVTANYHRINEEITNLLDTYMIKPKDTNDEK